MAKIFGWDGEKNRKLTKERGVSFEAIVAQIEGGHVLALVEGKGKYLHQRQFIVEFNHYVYIVPFVEDQEQIFLKTIIPSRKLTKRFLTEGHL